MRIAIAPDSFKGFLSADEAALCIEQGLRKAMRKVSFVRIPMADGGEGTVKAVVSASGGRILMRLVSGPLNKRVQAAFGLTGDGRFAVIEIAAACGLTLLAPRDRNPYKTSSRGVGELILHALDLGVKNIIIGLGGSATNDAGAGMGRALGVKFTDKRGMPLPEGGGFLRGLAHIDTSGLDPRIRGARIRAACDVTNPLTGPIGAARVFAPQKGADAEMVGRLETAMRVFERVLKAETGFDAAAWPGAGAAGGLGAGLAAFLGAELGPGVEIVMEAVGFRDKIRGCDLVITGEGRLDGQSVFGKTPVGVARAAVEKKIPVLAIGGCLGPGAEKLLKCGINAYLASFLESPDRPLTRRVAVERLMLCAEQLGRAIAAAPRKGN